MNKWFAITLGTTLGIGHIGMIGLVATNKSVSKLPSLNIPVGEYTSYIASVSEDGYKISYTANDPKTMMTTREVNKGGFFRKDTLTEVIEFTMDGAAHHGGPVSTKSAWIDPSAIPAPTEGVSQRTVECIEAIGAGKQTGRLVGSSVGASVAPAFANIPFVGWIASGWVTMFGGEQGSNIGGDIVSEFKDC
tara:strand:+ start:586 stop:1158 length:573 start_codon:yes stop_codon:yes gene_type:complete